MSVTVKVNGTANSLVHKGSNGVSVATVPDVCKTPSPGGPVPIPYPNVSQSMTLAKGTTTVKADGGMMIAIKGSEFSLSNGDNAGVAGGVKSSTFMKESTWILYSFDVKIDGQNACRLSDKKFQNHENTVDLGGETQAPTAVIMLECGECGSYSELQKKGAAPLYERDHIPSKAALREGAFNRAKQAGIQLDNDQRGCIAKKVEARGITVAIPKFSHRNFSPTCSSKNTQTQIANDAASPKKMNEAVDRDLKAMQDHLDGPPKHECADAYREAAKTVKAHDNEAMMKKAIVECTS
jgi:hypothetical protein